jgi:glutathione S-transferase
MLDEAAPEETRTHTLMKGETRLVYLNDHLSDREFLLDHFTVANAYLYTVLNWSVGARVSLSRYPAIKEYHRRLRIRPSVARAYQEEVKLYRTEPASHHARDWMASVVWPIAAHRDVR